MCVFCLFIETQKNVLAQEMESEKTDPAVVINARRTESLDAPHILNHVHTQTEELFGRVNIVNIMYITSII